MRAECAQFLKNLAAVNGNIPKKSVSFAAASSSPPARAKVKESSAFLDDLNSATSFKPRARVAHQPKPSTSGNMTRLELICAPGIVFWHIKL